MHVLQNSTRSKRIAMFAAGLLSLFVLPGCGGGAGEDSRAADRLLADAASNEALFDNVISSLLQLDTRVDMGHDKQVRILSERNTTDREPARATTVESTSGSGKFDIIEIVDGNAQFLANGVKKDDVLLFPIEEEPFDPEKIHELEQGGKSRSKKPKELRVRIAKVLDENRLLVARGFSAKIDPPVMVEVLRIRPERTYYIRDRLKQWTETGKPTEVWQPSPDEATLKQIVNRLNQWARNAEKQESFGAEDWTRDSHAGGAAAGTSRIQESRTNQF